MKTPILVNAAEMAKQYPESFQRPTQAELDHVKPGMFCKVCVLRNSDRQVGVPTFGERFWVEIHSVTPNGLIVGRVDNDLDPACGLNIDDVIGLHRDNIYSLTDPCDIAPTDSHRTG